MVVIATMQGQHSNQSSFFGMIYDELVPADHLLDFNPPPTLEYAGRYCNSLNRES